jgi:hypothetical protein
LAIQVGSAACETTHHWRVDVGAYPSVGDIAYFAPWGNLALFYKDFTYSEGLIVLGKLDGDSESFNVPGSVRVTIELAGKNDPERGG